MKKKRMAVLAGMLVAAISASVMVHAYRVTASDHVDSPLVTADQSADIADIYSFSNGDNLVLAMTLSNVQAAPEIQLGRSVFDTNVLYQFEIDNDGDAIEDLVIQAVFIGSPTDQTMKVRGPVSPEVTGTQARLVGEATGSVAVSTDSDVITAESGGIRLFAGVRDDPFFFDFAQFNAILAGEAAGFNDLGDDFFAGLNVYAIVIEVPLSMLGGDASALSVWGTTHRM